MRFNWNLLLSAATLAFALAAAVPARAESLSPEQTEALLAEVRSAWNLRAKDAPGFKLEARVDIAGMPEDAPPARWSLLWFDAANWKEELAGPGFLRLEVSTMDGHWKLLEPQAHLPLLDTIRLLLDPRSVLHLQTGQRGNKVKLKPTKGSPGLRRLIAPEGQPWIALEVGPEPGDLRAFERLSGDAPARRAIRFEYEGGVHVGTKSFPSLARVTSGGQTVVTVRVESVKPARKSDRAQLQAPNASVRLKGDSSTIKEVLGVDAECAQLRVPFTSMSPGSGGLVAGLLRQGMQVKAPDDGVAKVQLLIRADGTVGELSFSEDTGEVARMLVSTDSLMQKLYHPALCDGESVAVRLGLVFEDGFERSGARSLAQEAPSTRMRVEREPHHSSDAKPVRFVDGRSNADCASFTGARLLKRTRLEYPRILTRREAADHIRLDAVVSEEGRVLDAKVIESTHPAFRLPALRTVKKWEYEPARCDGEPVAVHVPTEFKFSQTIEYREKILPNQSVRDSEQRHRGRQQQQERR